MRITKEKKEAAVLYILRKIDEGTDSVAAYSADALEINKSTVHRYIKELIDSGIIEKSAHGSYRLSAKREEYCFDRSAGDFDNDWAAYDKYVHPFIEHLSDNVINVWKYVFSEMTNNVIDHSGADKASVTIKQDALNTSVVLKDNGVGIFEKIKTYFNYSSLDDAISELFKGKLTTDENNHSGEGIFFSSHLMDVFCIYSSGKLFSRDRYDVDSIFNIDELNSAGTIVFMKLSNTSKKQASEIFDVYADIDGGFTRTIIPVRNIFDSAPISRSQAKRLCNRLERFKEVTLDFSDVEWMGQGFAHQIFRVFAEQHPEVKLIPLNMNEKVLKMFRHVCSTY